MNNNKVTRLLNKTWGGGDLIKQDKNVFCEDEQIVSCQEKSESKFYYWLAQISLLQLAASHTEWSLHNDKKNLQEQQKCHNMNKVSPSASVMNFFPQWYVSCSNSL